MDFPPPVKRKSPKASASGDFFIHMPAQASWKTFTLVLDLLLLLVAAEEERRARLLV